MGGGFGADRDSSCRLVQDLDCAQRGCCWHCSAVDHWRPVVHGELGAKTNWITFLAGTVAIVLTFPAGRREIGDRVMVNPGSLGQPKTGKILEKARPESSMAS